MPIQRQEMGVSGYAFAVTPSDSSNFASSSRYLYVGTGGDLNVTTFNGQDVLLVGVPGGSQIFIAADRVNSTNTTASNIVAFV